MFRVLFVCTGNTCRSPMAEAIARGKLAGDMSVEVASAGISAIDGAPASRHAVSVVRAHGGELGHHESRLLDDEEVAGADLILTMTAAHRDVACVRWPERCADIRVLGDYAIGSDQDVSDPFGGTLDDYERAYLQIEALVEAALSDIRRASGRSES